MLLDAATLIAAPSVRWEGLGRGSFPKAPPPFFPPHRRIFVHVLRGHIMHCVDPRETAWHDV